METLKTVLAYVIVNGWINSEKLYYFITGRKNENYLRPLPRRTGYLV